MATPNPPPPARTTLTRCAFSSGRRRPCSASACSLAPAAPPPSRRSTSAPTGRRQVCSAGCRAPWSWMRAASPAPSLALCPGRGGSLHPRPPCQEEAYVGLHRMREDRARNAGQGGARLAVLVAGARARRRPAPLHPRTPSLTSPSWPHGACVNGTQRTSLWPCSPPRSTGCTKTWVMPTP